MGHAAARRSGSDKRAFAKRRLLPFYQQVKSEDVYKRQDQGCSLQKVNEELYRLGENTVC